MVANQSAHNLEFVVRPNFEVGLHALHQRTLQIVTFDLDHHLKRKALEQSQLLAEVVGVFVNGDPNLVGVVSVLSVNLVQTQAIVHRLFHFGNVLEVAHVVPVLQHLLHPALRVQQSEPNFRAKEFGDKQIALSLQLHNGLCFHAVKQLVERLLVIATLFNDVKGGG